MGILQFALTLVICITTFQASGAPAPKKDKDDSTKKFVEIGKKELSKRLKDPPSVRFMELMITESIDNDNSLKTLCGSFNAKNSFGGYGDSELFFVGFNSDGSVERVWIYDKGDSDDDFKQRYKYRMAQLVEFDNRCNIGIGKAKMIWTSK